TEQDYQVAIDYYNRAIAKGSMQAVSAMAKLYYQGNGVEKDLNKSLELYRLAAESGLSSAQNTYAGMLLLGEGTEKDPREAMVWFTRATEQGNQEAAQNLARLYRLGSDSGNLDASYALAIIYLNGLNGEQEVPAALYLLETAAQSGHMPSKNKLHEIYSKGRYGIAQDPEKASLWQ
ncbi:MAG: sel1 repeat family protein, partial [Gammaproteobacteria bacterium]|nr:sel1 repeat family protein [Gammaproteobacteria bacterium]